MLLLLSMACNRTPDCPIGTIYMDGACVGFTRTDPVDAEVWEPAVGTTWQWQLQGEIDTSLDVEMYNLDLFDASDDVIEEVTEESTLICYFSAGTYEDWREDAGDYPSAVLGDPLDEWEGEKWVDVRDDRVRDILEARLDLAFERGCDGVEPDNVDGYANDNGLGLNETEQLDFNQWIANEAHERGLSVALKNDLDQLEELVDYFDWHLDESCHEYDECDRLAVFTSADKAAFVAEYVDDWEDAESLADDVCGTHEGLSTIIKTWDLGPEFNPCP